MGRFSVNAGRKPLKSRKALDSKECFPSQTYIMKPFYARSTAPNCSLLIFRAFSVRRVISSSVRV